MQVTPFFSIIIPTLNEEKVLPVLLSDLKAQTYKDFEVFVVDGKSEDKTPKIVTDWGTRDERIQLLVSQKRNVGHQRNLGGGKAKGKFILFLDADDQLPPYFLAGIHYHCAKNPEITAFTAYARADTDNAKDLLFMSFMNSAIDTASKMNQPYAYGAFIGCRRDVFTEINGFDETITFAEDVNFVFRVVKAGYKFVVFKEPTFVYSLRRFRKEGTLRLIRNLAPIGLKNLAHKKITEPMESYPMLGGKYFEDGVRENKTKNKPMKRTVRQINAMLKTLRKIFIS